MTEIDAQAARRAFSIDDEQKDDYADRLARIQNEFLHSVDHFESEIVDPLGPANIERVCETDEWVGYRVEDIANVWPRIRHETLGIEMLEQCQYIHERTVEEELNRLQMFGHGQEGVVVFR